MSVSCAALTETLLESELFGYEKGAFTGANAQAKGKFELANGGTIFLDEIGDISPKLQADLLRVLQERRFYRVGGTQEVEVDVRIIAATNKNLAEEVQQGRFREDLYYRLNVIEIRLPPLRERREDIPLLAEHFRAAHLFALWAGTLAAFPAAALKVLIAYDWPGNVRELENVIERAIVTCRNGMLDEQDFSWLQTTCRVIRRIGRCRTFRWVNWNAGRLWQRSNASTAMSKKRPRRWGSIARRSMTSSSATRLCTERHART